MTRIALELVAAFDQDRARLRARACLPRLNERCELIDEALRRLRSWTACETSFAAVDVTPTPKPIPVSTMTRSGSQHYLRLRPLDNRLDGFRVAIAEFDIRSDAVNAGRLVDKVVRRFGKVDRQPRAILDRLARLQELIHLMLSGAGYRPQHHLGRAERIDLGTAAEHGQDRASGDRSRARSARE